VATVCMMLSMSGCQRDGWYGSYWVIAPKEMSLYGCKLFIWCKVWSTSLCTTPAKAWFPLPWHIDWMSSCWGATVWLPITWWNLYLDNDCTVLTQYGIITVVEQTNLINNEGLYQFEDIGVMKDDKDVYKMVKQLAQCTVADRYVNLSTVTIKCLQGLVYWVNDSTADCSGWFHSWTD
jgi:hypothetical protein